MSRARIIAALLGVSMTTGLAAPASAQDTHDIEFHALVPASDEGGLFYCLPAGTMDDPLRAGRTLELKDDTGDSVGFGVLEHVPVPSVEGMCETKVTFLAVPDAPVYFVLSGDQSIATRTREEMEAAGWVMTALYGTPGEPEPEPTPTPEPTPKPTPFPEVGVGAPFGLCTPDVGNDGEPVRTEEGRVRVLQLTKWKGNQSSRPLCKGCSMLTALVSVRAADYLGPNGGSICVSETDMKAVGKDGTVVYGWGERQPEYGTCFIEEGKKHQGWVTFHLPKGFRLDHLLYENYPFDFMVIRP